MPPTFYGLHAHDPDVAAWPHQFKHQCCKHTINAKAFLAGRDFSFEVTRWSWAQGFMGLFRASSALVVRWSKNSLSQSSYLRRYRSIPGATFVIFFSPFWPMGVRAPGGIAGHASEPTIFCCPRPRARSIHATCRRLRRRTFNNSYWCAPVVAANFLRACCQARPITGCAATAWCGLPRRFNVRQLEQDVTMATSLTCCSWQAF